MQPTSSRTIRGPFVRRALAGAALFGAGYAVAAAVSYSTSINTGLVQALNSVGQDLFGSQVFAARALPPNPIFPAGAVQLDVAADSRIGASVGVFIPNDPVRPTCTRVAQFEVIPPTLLGEGPGTVRLRYDPNFITAVPEALPPNPIRVARCQTQ